MTNLITPKNFNEVVNEVMKYLDKAESTIGSPGCSSDQVGEFRGEILNSIMKTKKVVREMASKSYLLT